MSMFGSKSSIRVVKVVRMPAAFLMRRQNRISGQELFKSFRRQTDLLNLIRSCLIQHDNFVDFGLTGYWRLAVVLQAECLQYQAMSH